MIRSPASSPSSPNVPWCEKLPRRPRCDVPWIGSANVLSDGRVNFCCFSDAVIGNVNEQPFEEIWNGPMIQRIRSELIAGTLPVECCTVSCPIYRGDEPSVIQMRMDGPFDPRRVGDAHAARRAAITRAALEIRPERPTREQPAEVWLELAVDADEFCFDLYVAARGPFGSFVFLPEWSEYPIPMVAGASVRRGTPRSLLLFGGDARVPPGSYQLTAALFFPDTNPMIASNCIHSIVQDVAVG